LGRRIVENMPGPAEASDDAIRKKVLEFLTPGKGKFYATDLYQRLELDKGSDPMDFRSFENLLRRLARDGHLQREVSVNGRSIYCVA
jgi:hypothetical protein